MGIWRLFTMCHGYGRRKRQISVPVSRNFILAISIICRLINDMMKKTCIILRKSFCGW